MSFTGFQPRLRRNLVAAAGVAASLAAFTAAAQDTPKNYGAVHVGQNDLKTWAANVDFGGTSVAGQLKLDRTLHWGVIVGREKDRNRLEVEYQRGSVKINQVTLGAVTKAVSATGHYQALTLNALRTFELTNDVNAFAGLGIGWGSASLPGLDAVGTCNCFSAASDGGLAVQARVGGEYLVGVDKYLALQYTWLRLPTSTASASPSVQYARKTIGAWGVAYRSGF